MDDHFETIVAQLKDEEARLSQRQQVLAAELRHVETDLKRVQGALTALIPHAGHSAPKRKRERPLGATRKQITSLVAEVLQDLGALDEERLRSEVESRLKDKRISRVGFAARFREALGDERFQPDAQGWKLITCEAISEFEGAAP